MKVVPGPQISALPIPTRFWVWLRGLRLPALGARILGFAMAWVAAGYGGAFAGLVLTAINLPRTLLLLLGGAVVDRVGAWRVMLCGDAVMTLVTGVFAGALLMWGPSPWLLLLVAVLMGTVDAFYMPASGSMPRRLVPDEKLAQAMSARQISVQLAAVVGGPIGAFVVASVGIAAAAIVNSSAYAVMFVILLLIRPTNGVPQIEPAPVETKKTKFGQAALEGLRISLTDPILRPGLLMLIGCAAFLLPVLSLILPVLARQQGWEATHVGLIYGVSTAFTAIIAMWVLLTGGFTRPGLAGCGGLGIAAVGILGLAILPGQALLVTSGALVGLGVGLFSTHIGPLLLGGTPLTHLGRIQAVVAMAQSLPLLVSNFLLGSLAQFTSARVALVICSVMLVLTAILAARSTQLRSSRRVREAENKQKAAA